MVDVKNVDNHFSLRLLRFFMRFVGMWPVESSRDQLISDLVLVYSVAAVIIALMIEGCDFYFSWGDLHAISYNAPTTITVAIEFVKMTKFVTNRHEVLSFNAYTQKTFWRSSYEDAELQILHKCNRQSTRIVITHIFFVQSVVWIYLGVPIFESYGKNSSERILPFNLYLDFPFTTSPYYEIIYLFEVATAMGIGVCMTSFSGFFCTTNLYAAGQFRILQRRLQLSCAINVRKGVGSDDQLYNKLRIASTYAILQDLVRQHQSLILYMRRIENLFSTIMLIQTLGSILEICFTGFQILLGVKTSIIYTIFSLQFFLGAMVQLLLFAWSSHEIIIESQEIAEAAYRATWYGLPCTNEGKTFRQSLLIIIARARKPCILTVGKFTPMSLNTFSSVFNTSVSYFTILRQMNEESE